jgi:hypothetical protein
MKQFSLFLSVCLAICISGSGQTSSHGSLASRASRGDTVWVLVNHIKADKRQVFEKFITETFWNRSKQLPPKDQQVFKQTRVLYPTAAEPDGTYSYIFIMDPLVTGGDYDIKSLLIKMYGEREGAKYNTLFDETAAGVQSQYVVVQSAN